MSNLVFNPELLATARKLRGLSQTKAAKLCGMSQSKYNKIENGVNPPNENTIEIFAKAFDFPEKFFQKNARALGIPMSFHEMHRKTKSVSLKDQTRVSADLTVRMLCISSLLDTVDIQEELQLPQYDAEDYGHDGEEIARMVRRTWLAPNGPVHNLTDLIEKAGIIVFPCYFPAPKVDGVTVNISGMPPVIFLNENTPADCMRFSLAHELGHIVMHRQISNTMENEANSFASELLMPEQEMKYEFNEPVTLKRLAELKRVYKVSMGALLVRAKSIGKISVHQSNYLWRQMSRLGYRKEEPPSTQFEKERPSTLKNIFDLYMKQLGYSTEDFASAFDLNVEMVKDLFTKNIFQDKKLRLVV